MELWNLILVLLNLTTIVSVATFGTEISFENYEKNQSEYNMQYSYSNNSHLFLHFLPGVHYISGKTLISNITNVEIFGNETVLSFKDLSALIVRNVTKLTFKNINLTDQVAVNITEVDSVVFEKCSINVKASVTALYIANVQTVHIANSLHTSTQGGVLSVKHAINLSIVDSAFIGNRSIHLFKKTAIVLESIRSVLIDKCSLVNNRANNCEGGAITLMDTDKLKISNSKLESNAVICFVPDTSGISRGGAIYSNASHLEISHCVFKGNFATVGGSIYSTHGSLYSSFNKFENSEATDAGGAIYIQGHISTSMDHFITNKANYGGAAWILAANATIFNNYFESNNAYYNGGAIHLGLIENGLVESFSNIFKKNNALEERGGAIYVLLTTNKIIVQESTDKLLKGSGLFSITDNVFAFNTANLANGGAIYSVAISLRIKMSQFVGNQALKQGASISHINSFFEAINCEFSSNYAEDNSMLYINSATFKCRNCTFLSNNGSLNAVNSIGIISGTTLFANNSGNTGGAITSLKSRISFTDGTVNITGNNAIQGGGIFIFESHLNITSFAYILKNVAKDAGGGIYAYRSTISYHQPEDSRPGFMEVEQNSALSGGGSYLIASTIELFQDVSKLQKRSKLKYTNNNAVLGGALYLDQISKIYFYKVLSGRETTTSLIFFENMADYGGAVYIWDETASSELCNANDEHFFNHYQTDCFIQILKLGDTYVEKNSIAAILNHHPTTYFTKNFASKKGNAIYGGLFDRCSLNPNAERTKKDHATYMMVFNNYENSSSYISSEAVQVCFCSNASRNIYDCTLTKLVISVKRGETFEFGITAIDQVENQLTATILAEYTLNSSTGTFKEGQTRQIISSVCTNIEFNVFTAESVVEIDIFAEGPCSNKGISKRRLEVVSEQCDCPIGFQPSKIKTKCECICDNRLEEYVYNCSMEDETVLLSQNRWIGFVNSTKNNTGFLIQTCPLDFCHRKPLNISLTTQEGIDMQCAFNRSNLLCGQCEEGYSQVIGSSRCLMCTNKFLSLLIVFGCLGIILVILVLILNMTVAAGTIHGVIFYANIVGTTQSVFFTKSEATPLKVFISWLNLDFGIETCFYDGMNAYARVLLQLIFPIYLILLITMIIVLCEHSQRFTKVLGKRNPVATLCTLILLSYSKLLNIVIAALQFEFLQYPDGTIVMVWLYDGTVPYFTTSHIPRFIIASLILALGTIYTLLLFFGQWLQILSRWKITKWISHPKYNAFIDAYHAPFTKKHRYWVGLLLFARILHTLVVALVPNDFVALLSIASVSLFILVLKSVNKSTYSNQKIEFSDNVVLINLILLSLGTFYIRESKSNELPLIAISTTLIFLQFLILLGYHIFKYILHNSKIWTNFKQIVSFQRPTIRNTISQHQLIPVLQDDKDEDTYGNDEMDHCLHDSLTTIRNTDSNTQQFYPPPNIQSALILDQLRLPYMDIVDPVTTDHYKKTTPKQPNPSTVRPVTTTFIDRPTS